MAFRRTYDEIRELIIKVALDPDMARGIMRKAGLIGGDEDGDGSKLLAQLLEPPPPNRSPRRPRRRVQNSIDFPFIEAVTGTVGLADGATWWDGRTSFGSLPDGDTTMSKLADMQYRYNEMWFTGFSDHQRPPLGAHLVNPDINVPFESLHTGKCWVGGATSYDPFPYPDAPYYLWADLAEAFATPYIGDTIVGNGAYPTNLNSGDAVGPIILKCHGSLDGGDTWGAPWEPRSVPGGTNAGAAYYATNLNPDYTPAPTEDGYPLVSDLKEEYHYDDVLFKFTLTTTDAQNWVEFENLGIRVHGIDG